MLGRENVWCLLTVYHCPLEICVSGNCQGGGHVPQCLIAGDANVLDWIGQLVDRRFAARCRRIQRSRWSSVVRYRWTATDACDVLQPDWLRLRFTIELRVISGAVWRGFVDRPSAYLAPSDSLRCSVHKRSPCRPVVEVEAGLRVSAGARWSSRRVTASLYMALFYSSTLRKNSAL